MKIFFIKGKIIILRKKIKHIAAIILLVLFAVLILGCAVSPSRNSSISHIGTVRFFYDGPQDSSAGLYYNGGKHLRTIAPGDTFQGQVPVGTNMFEVRIEDARIAGSSQIKTISVNVNNNTVQDVIIIARIMPSGAVIFRDLSITNRSPIFDTVASDWLNIRSSPSAAYNTNIIETIPRNTRVEILQRVNHPWVMIRYNDGKVGYVNSDLLLSE